MSYLTDKNRKKLLTKQRGRAIMVLPLRRGLFLSRISPCEGDKILGVRKYSVIGRCL